jgi:hypothetical protein
MASCKVAAGHAEKLSPLLQIHVCNLDALPVAELLIFGGHSTRICCAKLMDGPAAVGALYWLASPNCETYSPSGS